MSVVLFCPSVLVVSHVKTLSTAHDSGLCRLIFQSASSVLPGGMATVGVSIPKVKVRKRSVSLIGPFLNHVLAKHCVLRVNTDFIEML